MWSSPRRRAASFHITWCKISLSSPKLLWFFRNSRWRPPPSWIFSLYEFGSVVFVFCTKFGSNICYSHWDRRKYASDFHLMTSRELTSGVDYLLRGYLRMAVMHLHIKFGADIFIQSGVIHIFLKLKMAAATIIDFQVMWFGHSDVLIVWHLCSVPNLVQTSVIVMRSTHLCFRCSFDDVTRINFRFLLLVTWSSAHGRDASSCKIWCRYLYPTRRYWHFAKIKDGGRRQLGFVGGSHGTTHEGTLMVRTRCKNFVMVGSVGFKL